MSACKKVVSDAHARKAFCAMRLIGKVSIVVPSLKTHHTKKNKTAPSDREHTETHTYHKLGPLTRRREPRHERDVVGREFLRREPIPQFLEGRRLESTDRHQVTRPDVVDAGLRALWEVRRKAGLATSQSIDRLQSQ